MKKLALALAATAAFAGQAFAADMPARMPVKAAPVVAPVASWTGCYVAGGGGYGLWKQENVGYADPVGAPRVQVTDWFDNGGKGWFGTVQGGCDYQFSLGGSWQVVIGAFGDYDFADMNGRRTDVLNNGVGNEKLSSQWAVGGRIGVLVNPSLLTYFSGGYTEAKFDRTNFTTLQGPPFGVPTGLYVDGRTYKGWFLGSGYEYALSFMPGLYWKTEYRFSETDVATNPIRVVATGALFNESYDSKKYIHTVRSELVYRFNFGGPVVAKY